MAMKGFKILTSKESIEFAENTAGQFRLKAFDDGIELFQVDVYAGKSILCQPKDCEKNLNACVVLSGSIQHQLTGQILKPGDLYAFMDLSDTHYLSVLEDSTLLMIARRGHFLKKISKLSVFSEQMEKIQQTDHYTGNHCDTTGTLAAQIATRLRLNERQIENVLYAGKIHDVGKIRVPGEILNKPGPLTDEEYDIMKQHTQDGCHIVQNEIQSPAIAQIILDHHERLDGSGYPRGLKAEEISIEAKIIAVTDSYDAMTTDRPYRKAFSRDYAFDELRRFSGSHYEPEVVEALISIVQEN